CLNFTPFKPFVSDTGKSKFPSKNGRVTCSQFECKRNDPCCWLVSTCIWIPISIKRGFAGI
ncbi:unnamed protein product, partial [Allacma fusca]